MFVFGYVQVPLMEVLGSAVRALDGHREVPEVASNGLRFLANVAAASENQVSAPRVFFVSVARECGGWVGVLGGGGGSPCPAQPSRFETQSEGRWQPPIAEWTFTITFWYMLSSRR
jgi:hypothetical protein